MLLVELELKMTEQIPSPSPDMSENKDSCCGGPAIKDAQACCHQDEVAKTMGEDGCGCSDQLPTTSNTQSCCH